MRAAARVVVRLLFVCGAPWGGAARAADAEPLQMVEVARGIFVYQAPYQLLAPSNGGAIANVGFIVGRDAVAVIDTGNTLEAGRRLLAAVRARTDKPVRYVINTHMHPDHVFGDAAFAGEGVVFAAHARFANALRARAESYAAAGRRALGAEAAPMEPIYPTLAVEGERTIDLGGRTLELKAQPPAHTDNDLTVFDRETETWFLGDLLFVGHAPSMDGSFEGWTKVMAELGARGVARVVPGHGPASVAWPDALAPQRRYFDRLRADVQKLIDDGATIREASEKAGLSERDGWALFDEFNARNAIAAYKELEWR